MLKNKQLGVDYEYISNKDFSFASYSSWLQHFSDQDPYTEEDRVRVIKHILNGILRDLQDEPHFFRFDIYAKTINKYKIANILLYLLVQHFPDVLQKIHYACFYEACDNVNALKFITENKQYFPNLQLDKIELMRLLGYA